MELSYKLEEMFPTEESRFNAYKKWIVISAVLGPVSSFAGRALQSLIRIAEHSYRVGSSFDIWLSIFTIISLVGIVISLISLYISIYIYWKSNVIQTLLRMVVGIIIGSAIMFTLSHASVLLGLLLPVIGLLMNWARIKRYMESNDRFVKDNFKLLGMGILAFVVLLLGFGISIATSSIYGFNSIPLIIAALVALFLFYVWPPMYMIQIFNRERALGNTFLKAFYQFNITGVFILFSIISLTAAIHHSIFDGDTIVDDLTGNFSDPSMGGDGVYSANPDYFADVSGMNVSMHADVYPNLENIDTNAAGVMHNPDISHADFSVVDMNLGDNAVPHYSAFDVFPDNLANVFDSTNLVDIIQMQQHPYMLFSDPVSQGGFHICDPSGMPQMSVTDGNILNAEGVTIGHVHTDPVSGTTIFADIQNNPIYSVDSHGQMFSDNCYIGHTSTSGNVTVIRDIHENIIAQKDVFNGVWRDISGKIISQVKPM